MGSLSGGARHCLTGAERTAAEVAARIAAHPDLLHEVRLDLLERIDDELFPLLGSPRVIATCRRRDEGGAFAGSEAERARVLERALAAGPAFLDLELSTERTTRERLRSTERTRIILSCHAFGGLEEGRARARSLAAEPGADLLKLAVSVDDPAELAVLRELLPAERRPVLRIGMGPAGLLSRALPDRFGSPWSYVVAAGAEPIAPGQLDLARVLAWRLHEAGRLTPVVLLGGEQVLRSPGPTVYNRLFAARGLPYLYLPVASARPRETLALLEALGVAGASVTMPFKEALLPAAATLDAHARAAGAINTLRLAGDRRGALTDAGAAERLLSGRAGQPALLLGAGGAARAIAVALRALGCPLTVAARRLEQAAALEPLGAHAVPWADRGEVAFAILVNATPCGSDGASDPLPAGVGLAGRCLLELVLARDTPTPLVARARTEGAEVIDGIAFWLEQGALQLAAMLDLRVTPGELREYLRDDG
jgi:3-dehydroquinate dehydratase/shikimate dehydrogenase